MTDAYSEFLERKRIVSQPTGFEPTELLPELFDFQRDCVRWALRRGRAALWEDCGLGKSVQALEWARRVALHTGDPVLILTPLGVVDQFTEEGRQFGILCNAVASMDDIQRAMCPDMKPYKGIYVTNYEKLHKFDPSIFSGVVLDESSILKSFDGKTRNQLIEAFRRTLFKLCCTATPSPNDFMELGNHAEFLGIMTRAEMLSMFFVHDGGDTSQWRLKGHAEQDFWRWLASWAVNIRKPSDLGYDDGDFILPELTVKEHVVDVSIKDTGFLIPMEARTLSERRTARRSSISARCETVAKLASAATGKVCIWCNLNDEQDEVAELLGDSCVSIQGSTPDDKRLELEKQWRLGSVPDFVSKGAIFGWGMNWQHCDTVIYCGLSDSFEEFYQTVRRCWRFGQEKPVTAHIVISNMEGAVLANIKRKQADSDRMAMEMVKHMSELNRENIQGATQVFDAYTTDTEKGENFTIHLGDCVDLSKTLPDESIGFSVYSPPFSSLYTYSASERDMGNSRNDDEFFTHYKFLLKEIFRATKPGRLSSVHCMNLPTSKTRDGYIGIRDFRGEIIRAHLDAGWILHSEVCIWKDPVTAMQRTKALGLLHKQMVKDSCMSRQGIPDYLVTFRKPGENKEPVEGELDRWIGDGSFRSEGRLSIDLWQRYASPVWMDINPSRTLQRESAREENDERHICPLQLDVIERAVELWSNPGDLVLSPFAGICSEGVVSLERGRKFVGFELKRSYWAQGVDNLKLAECKPSEQGDLFQ